jgi:hypothetical protein
MKTCGFFVRIFIIIVFFGFGKTFASDSLNVKKVVDFLPHYDVTNMVDKIGNYVYTGVADSDLIVVSDFSDIQSPSEVYRGTLQATDLEEFISSEPYGYLAAGYNGLYVLDITNPAAPNIVGHVETNGYAMGMDKFKNFIVLNDRDNVLFIDVKNPSEPQLYTTLGSSIAGDLVVNGTTLYIADPDHGLYAYNISNLDSIKKIGKIASYNGSSYTPRALATVGERAFVTDYDYNRHASFLKVIDIAHPETMSVLAEYKLEDHIANHDYIDPWQIIIEGDYAYLGDKTNGIVILDIQDIQNIHQVGYYSLYKVNDQGGVTTNIQLQKFDVENGYIFTAWKNHGGSTYHKGLGYVLENTLVTSTQEAKTIIPGTHHLFQNFPNPFNPQTTITYFLENGQSKYDVKLEIFNLNGQKIATLVNEKQHAGSHSVIFRGDRFPSGIYLCRLTVNNLWRQSKKMILIR